jgi:hypothetical protein
MMIIIIIIEQIFFSRVTCEFVHPDPSEGVPGMGVGTPGVGGGALGALLLNELVVNPFDLSESFEPVRSVRLPRTRVESRGYHSR